MSSWKECKLGDVAKLSKKTWKVGDELMPYIGLEHIEESKLRLNAIGNSENVASNKFRFQAGDTLFGKLRPYFRKVIKPSFDGICSTDIWVLNAQKGIDKDFLFYFFANQELVDISYSASSGTRMPRADWDFLSQTVWNIPPLEEQKVIAEVLSSLDDKIDLLHRQNQTLESLAQTLFRQWFIEEAKEEWEEKPLGKITNIAIGRTPPRKEEEWFSTDSQDVKWISIKDLGNDGAFIFKTSEYLTQEAVEKFNVPVIPKDTVLLSFKMTVGRVAITTETMLSNEAIAHFKFYDKTPISKEYLYLFLKTFSYESLGSTSSIVTAINSAMIKEMMILIPDEKTIKDFSSIAEPQFEKIRQNQKQIQTLENLRDTLLPKLLSGEVKIGG
ncbi:restriction endonuclease subunit S [Aliarcobacter butzleri]|uniref:restriction endonuclease subunit S n=1 Tax=Aliarcobacter butzleri TaxID=28197 RepID=UPI00263DAC23|nr:restriction endonuclease subunit S [Aliarcobacter butzleri]MDN5100212.1 restriction endonuclease subunit S [Aliarcobacter butzleri]